MNINLTLIGQTIVFAIFVWFCMKFIWPPIIGAMIERKKQIADGLAAAEKGHKAKLDAQQKADLLLADTKVKAAEIINQANNRSNEVVNEAKRKANIEVQNLKSKAEIEIESMTNSVREKLRKEVSSLVLSGVKQIVAREVKAEDHQDILSGLGTKL